MGWFTVLGATLVVLGALAFLGLPPAGDASVSAVGMFMLIGAFAFGLALKANARAICSSPTGP
jgi:hypothetical protein